MDEPVVLRYSVYDTAIGDVTIIANEKAITGLLFGAVDPTGAINEENAILYDAIIELNQYCYGQRKSFDLRIKPEGSEFDQKVWNYVKTIPYGSTKTYEEVAKAIGEDGETKEVANSLNHNPIPFFIPCHRVLGKGGAIEGYVGGSDLKKKLLNMEKVNATRVFHPENYEDPQ